MQYNTGDMLVVQIGDKRKLVRYSGLTGLDSLEGFDEKSYCDKQELVKFKSEDVLSNHGPDPEPGSSYGVKLNKFYRKVPSLLADVHLYYSPSEAYLTRLIATLDECAQIYIDKGWVFAKKFRIEIYKYHGQKMIGWYKHNKKDEVEDVLALCNSEDDPELKRLVHHEYTHRLQSCSSLAGHSKAKAAWIKRYHEEVTTTLYNEEFITKISDAFTKSQKSLKDWFLSLEDDEKAVMKKIFKHIKEKHKLDAKDLQTLWLAEEDIIQYFPSVVELIDVEILLTEYARKNPNEFMAEIISYHLIGKTIPASVLPLVEKTLHYISK